LAAIFQRMGRNDDAQRATGEITRLKALATAN
jgi:hypothetical protein